MATFKKSKVSLAKSSVFVDWRRYTAITVMLSLVGLLFNVQIGLLLGFQLSGDNEVLDSRADIVLLAFGEEDRRRNITENETNTLWLNPNIERVEGLARDRNANIDYGIDKVGANIKGLSLEPNSLSFPKVFTNEQRVLLSTPYAILMSADFVRAEGLKIGQPLRMERRWGREKDLPSTNVFLAGVTPFEHRPGGTPVYVSEKTKLLIQNDRVFFGSTNEITYLLITVKNKSRIQETSNELTKLYNDRLSSDAEYRFQAFTMEEYNDHVWDEIIQEEGMYILLASTVGFLAFISIVVISQVMRTNLLAQIKEFGTLHALGFKRTKLSFIAMRQGFWVGVMGCLACSVCFVIAKGIFVWFLIPVYTHWIILSMSFVILLVTSTVSGFLSVGVLKRIELTSLLR